MEVKAGALASATFEIEEHGVEPVSELAFGVQSGKFSVLRVSVESYLEVAFGAQSREL